MKHFILTFASIAMLGGHPASAEPITVLDANDLAWETTREGVAFAALQGNRFEEAYQAMVHVGPPRTTPPRPIIKASSKPVRTAARRAAMLGP